MATQGEIARHLDLSERQINNLQKMPGFPVPQGRGQYDLDACRLWYIRYLRTTKPGSSEPEMEGDESSKTLDRQKAELANEYRQEQIENLRLRRMVLSKQYAPITVLSAVLLQWCTGARTRVDSWLPRLKMVWPDVPHHVITLFRNEIAALMNELADVGINPEDYCDSDIESGFASDPDLEDEEAADRSAVGG
jgi:phage terminase Nu1 subunit (DNA packaging protein)